jgi:hypothetical protein
MRTTSQHGPRAALSTSTGGRRAGGFAVAAGRARALGVRLRARLRAPAGADRSPRFAQAALDSVRGSLEPRRHDRRSSGHIGASLPNRRHLRHRHRVALRRLTFPVLLECAPPRCLSQGAWMATPPRTEGVCGSVEVGGGDPEPGCRRGSLPRRGDRLDPLPQSVRHLPRLRPHRQASRQVPTDFVTASRVPSFSWRFLGKNGAAAAERPQRSPGHISGADTPMS